MITRSKLYATLLLTPPLIFGCGEDLDDVADLEDMLEGADPRVGLLPEVCNGAPEAAALGILPPVAPQPGYTLPGGPQTTTVWDTASLEAAAADPNVEDIILRDGIYAPDDLVGDYLTVTGKRLWAQHQGKAVLKFGIQAGGNNKPAKDWSNPEFHGLVFDIEDPTHTPLNKKASEPEATRSAIYTWGDATELVVEDCLFFGNGVIPRAISNHQPDAFEARRLVIRDFRRVGIIADQPTDMPPPVPNGMIIEDVDISGINDPGGSPGPADHPRGMQLGEQAIVSRVKIRDVRWTGIVTVENTDGSWFEHLDIDEIGVGARVGGAVGVYFERMTRNSMVAQSCIGPQTKFGVRTEWDGDYPGPRGINNTVARSLIESAIIGVHHNQGTVASDVYGVTFRNYSWAAINMLNNLSSEALWPNYDDGGAQWGNLFLEPEDPDGGPCCFSRSQIEQGPPVCEVGGCD